MPQGIVRAQNFHRVVVVYIFTSVEKTGSNFFVSLSESRVLSIKFKKCSPFVLSLFQNLSQRNINFDSESLQLKGKKCEIHFFPLASNKQVILLLLPPLLSNKSAVTSYFDFREKNIRIAGNIFRRKCKIKKCSIFLDKPNI